MRTIKFRYWEKPDTSVNFQGAMHYNCDEYFNKWCGSADYETMQFTGLLDRLGKEIWEGDIVKLKMFNEFNSNEIRIGECFWNEKTAQWTFKFESSWEYPACDWVEIIGNIYQNPNLLTK